MSAAKYLFSGKAARMQLIATEAAAQDAATPAPAAVNTAAATPAAVGPSASDTQQAAPATVINEATGDATSADTANTGLRRGRKAVRVRVTGPVDAASSSSTSPQLTVPLK